jgi:phosphoglycolate phosphatase
MNPPLTLTDDIFTAFLKCKYKAYLKLTGLSGEKSDYEQVQVMRSAEYRGAVSEEWRRRNGGAGVAENQTSLPEVILDATISDAGESCHLDALEKVGNRQPAAHRPVLFIRHEKVTPDDRLLLAFAASILARVQGTPPTVGKIVHGRSVVSSRVDLASLAGPVREKIRELRVLQEDGKAPPLRLNKHCQGVPLARLPFLVREILATQRGRMAGTRLFPGLAGVLQAVRQAGCRLGVLSSHAADNIQACLRGNGVEGLFDAVVGYRRLFGKARAIRRFVRDRGVARAEVLYVGDEVRDIEAARKAGVAVAAVTWGFNTKELLARHGPDYLVERPEHILSLFT